ncbi:MAG: restriction endonuclease [Chloroflexota bacterium]|nr:restriction endonuclease [Chloroflexota bacterium]MDE2885222.1 restriction endonuclease [Chloroflexota bacterium]
MRQLDLKEHVPSESYSLSSAEHDALRLVLPSLTIERIIGAEDTYTLTPGSWVGAVEVGDLSVLIRPKLGIPELLSLACYATDRLERGQQGQFNYLKDEALPDALALALVAAARRTFARGLLHGYRTEEETLYTVRGRIRFDDQVRRRFGIPLPVEVRYDEFTEDIPANRLVKAAVIRLGRMRLRSTDARRGLGWVAAMLENVSYEEFPSGDVPEVTFNRLNEHYRGVVTLARLILRRGAFEAYRGQVRASGFLMDMNQVFQEFVTVALREALGVTERTFGEYGIPSLDEAGRIHLRPDLVWREGSSVVFVGDAKYKRIGDERIPNADLYQLLAYTTALDLPGGLLVYAKGEADAATYTVRHSGKRLEVAALDLTGTLEQVLERVRELAVKVRALRGEARQVRPAA